MATDYQAIRLALARGDSWAQITEDVGCSRRTIDKAARAMKSMGFVTSRYLLDSVSSYFLDSSVMGSVNGHSDPSPEEEFQLRLSSGLFNG